jgi:integrase
MNVDTSYLQLRRRTWYAQLKVPVQLRPAVGKSLLSQSLKTRDIAEASRRKHVVLAEFHRILDTAQGTGSCTGTDYDRAMSTARGLIQQVQSGTLEKQEAGERWGNTVTDLNYLPDDAMTAEQVTDIRAMGNAIENPDQHVLIAIAIEKYLDSNKSVVRRATTHRRTVHLHSFTDWYQHSALSSVRRADAGRYVGEVLELKGLAPATVRQCIGDLSGFFQWCAGRGMCSSNPFDGVAKTVRSTKRGVRSTGDELRPWTDDELVQLLEQTPHDGCLWIASVLALYTGMRQNEIASIECNNVLQTECGTAIKVPEAKTDAGKRTVPVHPVIAPLVAQLLSASTDGYLVPGLKPGGYDGKRGYHLSKRFSYHKRKVLKLPSALQFHGLRKNFSTALYRAGVPVDRIQQIIGHTGGTLAQDVYIDGSGLAQLVKDVSKIEYSTTVTQLVTDALPDVCGTDSSTITLTVIT